MRLPVAGAYVWASWERRARTCWRSRRCQGTASAGRWPLVRRRAASSRAAHMGRRLLGPSRARYTVTGWRSGGNGAAADSAGGGDTLTGHGRVAMAVMRRVLQGRTMTGEKSPFRKEPRRGGAGPPGCPTITHLRIHVNAYLCLAAEDIPGGGVRHERAAWWLLGWGLSRRGAPGITGWPPKQELAPR